MVLEGLGTTYAKKLTFEEGSIWKIVVTSEGHYGKLVVDNLRLGSIDSLSILHLETKPQIGKYQIATYRTLHIGEGSNPITNGKTLTFKNTSSDGMSFTATTESFGSNGLSAIMLRVAPPIEVRVGALEDSMEVVQVKAAATQQYVTALRRETPYSRKMDKILQDTYALSPTQAAWQAMWLPYTASKFFALGFWTWLNK